jgi:uncharacterized phage protein (TIGR01671 family)
MREIKFRAFTNGNMRYNVGFHPYMSVNLVSSGVCESNEFKKSDEEMIWSPGLCQLMQYTDLKDKNGKEIYDGDIIEYTSCGVTCKALIVWNNHCGAWQYQYRGMIGHPTDFLHTLLSNTRFPANVIVTGNIYENPELVKTIKE